MNTERLLNVAKALRESKSPDKFTMACYGHPCGTPACALGHYAARPDLQTEFFLGEDGDFCGHRFPLGSAITLTLAHFDIAVTEWGELFGGAGCGNAKTPIEAAEYIERFVERHKRESAA